MSHREGASSPEEGFDPSTAPLAPSPLQTSYPAFGADGSGRAANGATHLYAPERDGQSHQQRRSSDTHSVASAYPSGVRDNYINSYYYGRYDHELNLDLDASHDITRAGPSNWASTEGGMLLSSPLIQPRSSGESRDYINGVSLGHKSSSPDLQEGSVDVTSWHPSRSPAMRNDESTPATEFILASPEELQRTDPFARQARYRWSASRPTPDRADSTPSIDTLGEEVTAATSGGGGGSWFANSQYRRAPGAGPAPPGQTATPFRHPTGKRKVSDGVPEESPERHKTVGFLPARVASVPLADLEDAPHLEGYEAEEELEDAIGGDNAPIASSHAVSRRGSGDIIATAGGDSPAVKQAKIGLNRMHRSIRRISRRVVDINGGAEAQAGPEALSHVRLADDADDSSGESDREGEPNVFAAAAPEKHAPTTGTGGSYTLRGKSLGLFGPESRFRRRMAQLLGYWWVEPAILLVIVTHVVIVVIQSSHNVFSVPRLPGYFDAWEDVALLVVFSIYTAEVAAKVIVSGLVINPPPVYAAVANSSESFRPSRPGSLRNFEPSQEEKADVAEMNIRRMSRSNTLDAWSELGSTLKSRAHQALHAGDRANRQSVASTADHRAHQRTGTVATIGSTMLNGGPAGSRLPTVVEGSAAPTTQATSLTQPLPAVDPTSESRHHPSRESSRILRNMQEKAIPFSSAIITQRGYTTDYAYLRHSWNRIDALAVLCYWVFFFLAVNYEEMTPNHHIYIFRALSVLRVARLLTITSGTSTILQSLKLAAPLLANVLFFAIFAMLLFSIIGIQSFKGSYRRSCVWLGDVNTGINAEPGSTYTLDQLCGGWYNATGQRQNYIMANGLQSPIGAKGFLCPIGQQCQEASSNPNQNSQSFDNIFTSLLEIVIVISSNGWSDTMYNMIDSDYFVASIFFIAAIIFLNFWLANLFVAVITNSFATISSQTRQSAFSRKNIDDQSKTQERQEDQSLARRRRKKVASVYKRLWSYTYFPWLGAIIASLGVQASGAVYDTTHDLSLVAQAELWFTIAFDIEIVLRFLSYALDDDWRSFFSGHHGGRNKVDVGLCVITTIIQIPVVTDSGVYPWLTIFQLQRFYRVIIAIPRMERLLLRVFGSLSGLLNMIIFLLLMVGLAALIAVQLFRGDIPAEDEGDATEMTFKHVYNGYLAMYQIFSSEDWNSVLFNVISNEVPFKQDILSGIFIGGWFLFANFIVLQMFIAVINEGFSFSEAERRRQQLDHYLRRLEPAQMTTSGRILHKLSPYRYLKDRNAAILKQSATGSVNAGSNEAQHNNTALRRANTRIGRLRQYADGAVLTGRRLLRWDRPEDAAPVPLDSVRQRQVRQSFSGHEMLQSRRSARMPSMYDVQGNTIPEESPTEDEAARVFARERQITRMRTDLGLVNEKPTQSEIDHAHVARFEDNPRIAMAKVINEHPSYDKSLWLFSNHSKFRRFCQSLVPPSHGERIFGRQHSPRRLFVAQVVMFVTIIASIVVAGVASPLYRKDWYARNGVRRDSWFSMVEVILSVVFFAEFFIKVIADGLAFTPNAYLLAPWNLLDMLVLLTLVVNVSTELAVIGGVSRFTRALKAFRALRLINLSARMRSTLENLVIGGGKFVDASILAILYIIPFAVWGQNLFSGLLYSCTDDGDAISYKADCVGEYLASPSEWTFLAPRVWSNPTEGSSYSFDDFKSALLILFEIVSLEGWIDVMSSAMAIVGKDRQPSHDARQVNALFFVIYNLIGAIFVLTLFVSVIIEGFQSATGAAFFSTEQRQWIDLKRLISRQRPSKRPARRPTSSFKAWCYERATRKHDWWGRLMTLLYISNFVTLCTQSYEQEPSAERIRDGVYVGLAVMYGIDVLIRFFGLGWSAFRRSWWCIFDSVVVVGIIANSIPLLFSASPVQANVQLQKVFLTAATLKLVSKHNGLNQLFKTAISGLPAIVSLLGLWLCFFLFFAIMFVEIFGLTKWGFIGGEKYSRNFSSLPLTLIFLSMMSTGEGWNGYMHDYTVEAPLCTPSANYLDTDCGSEVWAYFLFIGWNVISMYIFLNMFTGTVVENFSYIFQLGGKPIVGREDMRGFKRAWFHVVGTGNYLTKDQLTPFFRSLPDKFEIRLHPEQFQLRMLRAAAVGVRDIDADSVAAYSHTSSNRRKTGMMSRLRRAASPTPSTASLRAAPVSSDSAHRFEGIDLTALQAALNAVDKDELLFRRERYNRIYHEASLLAEESDEGISFHDMLMLLAHYKLIDDDLALAPQELLDRRIMNERVEDRMNLERVRGIMATTYLRYRFNALRSERERVSNSFIPSDHESVATDNVPIITVDRTQSPPTEKGRRLGERPHLHLDTSALSEDATDVRLSPTTPTSSAGMQPLMSEAGSPGARSVASSHLDHGSAPSLDELERRASPLLEQFSGSAWGKLMRRVSVVSSSESGQGSRSPRHRSPRAPSFLRSERPTGNESSTALSFSSMSSANRVGGSGTNESRRRMSASTAGEDNQRFEDVFGTVASPRSQRDEHGAGNFYAFDSDNAWTSRHRTPTPDSALRRRSGDDSDEKGAADEKTSFDVGNAR